MVFLELCFLCGTSSTGRWGNYMIKTIFNPTLLANIDSMLINEGRCDKFNVCVEWLRTGSVKACGLQICRWHFQGFCKQERLSSSKVNIHDFYVCNKTGSSTPIHVAPNFPKAFLTCQFCKNISQLSLSHSKTTRTCSWQFTMNKIQMHHTQRSVFTKVLYQSKVTLLI